MLGINLRNFLIALFIFSLVPYGAWSTASNVTQGITIYVNPNGDDRNNGLTATSSVATPQRALTIAQDYRNNPNYRDIIIELAGGRYSIADTIVINQNECSGDQHLYFINKENEIPELNGGEIRNYTGTQNVNGVFVYTVPDTVTRIDELFVNGKRAVLARYPNIDVNGNTDTLQGFINSENKILLSANANSFSNLIGASVVVKHTYYGTRYIVVSQSSNGVVVDSAAATIQFGPNSIEGSTQGRLPFYLENAYSLLDAPGEFYFNANTHQLFYRPRNGETIANSTLSVPRLPTILAITSENYTNPANGSTGSSCHVYIGGLKFTQSSWPYPFSQGLIERQGGLYTTANQRLNSTGKPISSIVPAAITIQNASFVSFIRNRIEDTGGNGINIEHSTYGIKIIGNVFTRVANTGMLIDTQQEPFLDTNRVVENTFIYGNYFYDIGTQYISGSAIFATLPKNITIQNNEIDTVPNLAIHTGWLNYSSPNTNLQQVFITRNKISRAAYDTSDSGGIHTKNNSPNSIISENYITDINATTIFPSGSGKGSNGVYLDNYTSGYVLDKNVFSNVTKNVHLNNEFTFTPMTYNGVFNYQSLAPANSVSSVESYVRENAGLSLTAFGGIRNALQNTYIGGSQFDYQSTLALVPPSVYRRFTQNSGFALNRDTSSSYVQNFEAYSPTLSQSASRDYFPINFYFYNASPSTGSLSIVDAGTGNQKLQISDTGTSSAARQRVGVSLNGYSSGTVTFSARVKALQSTGALNLNIVARDTTYATNTFKVASLGLSNSSQGIKLVYNDTVTQTLSTYAVNTWYTLKMVLNLNTKVLQSYINDILFSTNTVSSASASLTLDSLSITAENGTGTYVVDDFTVQSSDNLNSIINIVLHPISASYLSNYSGALSCVAYSTNTSYSIGYQWQKSSSSNGEYTDILGMTSSNYYLPTENIGTTYYRVKVIARNRAGDEVTSSYSNVASVNNQSINDFTPTIRSQPQSATYTTEQISTINQLSVAADTTNQSPLFYQWQSATTANGIFNDIPGATSDTYFPSLVNIGSMYYRVIITSRINSDPDSGLSDVYQSTSNVAIITIIPSSLPSVVISSQPLSGTYNLNQIANSLQVVVNDTSIPSSIAHTKQYQWQSATTVTGPFTNISGANSSNFIPVTTSAGVVYYRALITISAIGYNSSTITSAVATITINQQNSAAATITTQPVSASYQFGALVTPLQVIVSSIPSSTITYQWQTASSSNGSFTSITGATTSTFSPSTSALGVIYYRVVVTSTESGKLPTTTISLVSNLAVTPSYTILPTITSQPTSRTTSSLINLSDSFTFQASCPSYATVSNKWQYSLNGTSWNFRTSDTSMQTSLSSYKGLNNNIIPTRVFIRVRVYCNYPDTTTTNIYSNVVTLSYVR
ncbi:MAG: right-handed parallel beta-helix repeat-containing protein [Methylacidiphilales bacterium]|nr:right-handed parallel beta-helix repeat-containing protein [Candidatus Methylacidiphilales bacterium]